jgi:hypothetical protein
MRCGENGSRAVKDEGTKKASSLTGGMLLEGFCDVNIKRGAVFASTMHSYGKTTIDDKA